MNKKVIITGVTGMDGSYMVEYLLEKGYEVYGVIRRTSIPNLGNIQSALSNIKFKLVTGDLTDSHSINKVVQEVKPQYFVNFGAQSFVGASWDIPEQTFDVTATGVLRCLEAIRNYAPDCRFYNAGSSEQFGDVVYSPQDEKHPFRPRSPYAAAKCAAHNLVKVYRESYGLYAVQGLLFNHESERRGPEFVTRKITQGVASIYHSISRDIFFNPIELGNLDAKRDWSHSRDFIEGVWLMLNQDVFNPAFPTCHLDEEENRVWVSKNTKDYVLSSGQTHSIREFVERAFSAAGIQGYWAGEGLDEKYRMVGSETSLVEVNPKFYRPAEVNLLLGDSSLARKELGWEPQISFDSLVTEMVHHDLL